MRGLASSDRSLPPASRGVSLDRFGLLCIIRARQAAISGWRPPVVSRPSVETTYPTSPRYHFCLLEIGGGNAKNFVKYRFGHHASPRSVPSRLGYNWRRKSGIFGIDANAAGNAGEIQSVDTRVAGVVLLDLDALGLSVCYSTAGDIETQVVCI